MLAASQEGLFCMTLMVVHYNEIDSYNWGIFKAATEVSVLMNGYIIPCHDKGHISVMLVLQSCTDSRSACETFPTPSDGTCDVGNVKVEEDIDIKEEEDVKQRRA
jgi:hypothetical protein